jgi:hypothetical protein
MLTAVVESCGIKCNAYWPDVVGDSRKYSNLTIQLFDIAEVSYAASLYWHGQINCKDSKAKCRHLKKITGKGTLQQVFIDWRYSQSCFVDCCPSKLLSGLTLPPFPLSLSE